MERKADRARKCCHAAEGGGAPKRKGEAGFEQEYCGVPKRQILELQGLHAQIRDPISAADPAAGVFHHLSVTLSQCYY